MDKEIVSGLPKDQHEYGLANGHAPIADKVICVDFDSTLVKWSGLMDDKVLTDGAHEFMWMLRREGWHIVIFTSRLSVAWARSVVAQGDVSDGARIAAFCVQQEQFVRKTLRTLDIPFDKITGDKVPAMFYVDDKAISFKGDWDAVRMELTI